MLSPILPRVSGTRARWTVTACQHPGPLPRGSRGARPRAESPPLRCSRADRADNPHPERLRPRNHLGPDVASAEHRERARTQPARDAELLLVPALVAEGRDVVGDAPIEVQEVPERELGDGDGVLFRAVRHVHAALARRLAIDRVHASARPDDERERLGALDVGAEHLGAPDNQHLRPELADPRGQRLSRELGLDDRLDPEVLQPAWNERREFVSDDHHGADGSSRARPAGLQDSPIPPERYRWEVYCPGAIPSVMAESAGRRSLYARWKPMPTSSSTRPSRRIHQPPNPGRRRLRPGDRLPSVRRASRDRGVSIATVIAAYMRLENDGVVEVRPKSGHFVRRVEREARQLRKPRLSCAPGQGRGLLGRDRARPLDARSARSSRSAARTRRPSSSRSARSTARSRRSRGRRRPSARRTTRPPVCEPSAASSRSAR